MRILYVASSTIPSDAANSVQVMRMSDALAAAGHDVLLVARPGRAGTDAHAWYGTTGRFAVETGLWSGTRWIGMLRTARRVGGLARSWNADLAYGRDPIGLLGAAAAGVPVVYEVHHPPETARRARIEHRLLHHRSLQRVVAITGALADHYRSRAPEAVEILTAHDAADDPGPRPAADGPVVVGYCGSLRPGKGGDLVVELARRLADVPFVVVGGTPAEVAALRERAPANLELVGAVPPAEVGRQLERFTIAVAPYGSRVLGADGTVDLARWMSPLKIYEYLANGLPIVASDLPVLREVLVGGHDCELVPADDVAAWALVVRSLVEDPDRRRRMGASARRTFLEGLTWDARAVAVLAGLPVAGAPIGGRP